MGGSNPGGNYEIIYVINIEIDRQLIGSQLCVITYTCFSHIQILSTLNNCCHITYQKSMHLAQHLNASINYVSCKAGKKNQTCLEQGIFLLHRLFKKYILFSTCCRPIEYNSKFHSVFVSFILHPCIKLMTNKFQPLPCKVSEKFSVVCGDYLFQCCMKHSLVMLAYLRFM